MDNIKSGIRVINIQPVKPDIPPFYKTLTDLMAIMGSPVSGIMGTVNRPNPVTSNIASNIGSQVIATLPGTPIGDTLQNVNTLSKTIQDKHFWFNTIALIAGVILAIIALQGFILSETTKAIK